MNISAEFLAPGANASVEEANTVARLKICVGRSIATDLRKAGEQQIVDHIVMPVYPLAESIAFRWWQILYGRGRKVSMRALRSGFVMPDITLTGIGNDQIEITCKPFAYENPNIQFVSLDEEKQSINEVQDQLLTFLMSVLDQLGERKVAGSLLSAQFEKIEASLDDDDELEFCRAAGAFDVDPYTADDRVAGLIEDAARLFDSDGLEEFLAGSKLNSAIGSIEWLRDAEHRLGEMTELPGVEDLRGFLNFRRRAAAPWTEGYASARKARHRLGLQSTDTIESVANLSKLLGNKNFKTAPRSPSSLKGASHVIPGHAHVIVGSAGPESELFTVARTVGDALHFGTDHYSPVTGQVGTYRQQLGRAFAAEFLAPVESILEMQETGRDDEQIAHHFGVSEWLIHHQFENRYKSIYAQ